VAFISDYKPQKKNQLFCGLGCVKIRFLFFKIRTRVLEINMKSLQENMVEFRKQLEKGSIQKAYLGLMEYMMSLKNHFSNKYPDYSTPGSLYNGYMDMTYFSIFPKSLKDRDLKIAIVFLYDTFRFEIWLSGKNKQVLAKYWQIISRSNQ
jgi:hypothetical protein